MSTTTVTSLVSSLVATVSELADSRGVPVWEIEGFEALADFVRDADALRAAATASPSELEALVGAFCDDGEDWDDSAVPSVTEILSWADEVVTSGDGEDWDDSAVPSVTEILSWCDDLAACEDVVDAGDACDTLGSQK